MPVCVWLNLQLFKCHIDNFLHSFAGIVIIVNNIKQYYWSNAVFVDMIISLNMFGLGSYKVIGHLK